MYVKFKDDSSKFDFKENKHLALEFKKDEVRYETRGAELVKNGVATEVKDYDAYLAGKDDKIITVPKAEAKK